MSNIIIYMVGVIEDRIRGEKNDTRRKTNEKKIASLRERDICRQGS